MHVGLLLVMIKNCNSNGESVLARCSPRKALKRYQHNYFYKTHLDVLSITLHFSLVLKRAELILTCEFDKNDT